MPIERTDRKKSHSESAFGKKMDEYRREQYNRRSP